MYCILFFQAEDGIRDVAVTGVQTCALPILTFTATVAPSLSVTVPVGVPEPVAGFTVAVNVTAWPKADGFNEEINVVADKEEPGRPQDDNEEINVVADKEEPGRPQDVNLKDPTRVFQLNEPLVVRYSFVYQKVQSSAGSTLIPL